MKPLQVFEEFRYGKRGVLTPGDPFRVAAGPVYLTDNGKRTALYERGVYVFRRYCVRGRGKWIEAHRPGVASTVILFLSASRHRQALATLRARPYRVLGRLPRERYTAPSPRQRSP